MDIKTVPYWSKSEMVRAIRLTEDNIHQVAQEIGREYSEGLNSMVGDKAPPIPFIMNGKSRAFIGDWVAQLDDGFDIVFFEDEEFMKKFTTHTERAADDEKYAKIFQLVMSAMNKQDTATYHGDSNNGMDLVAISTTKQILNEL